MKLFFATLMIAWISFTSTFALAQSNFNLNGKVISSDGKAVDGATLYLFNATDSVLLKTAISDANGLYQFQNIPTGNYKLTVMLVGFESYKGSAFALNQDKNLGTTTLKATQTTLNQVTVTAQRPFVQQKVDRMVVNPEALISNAGSTALEVLEKAPGVIVDQNGAISLKGLGVTIFIDDKPTYLSGADLESYLRSMSSASIDQIELMTNPPAKYDAAGNGGVINIRTKRTQVKGFNGALNLSYAQGSYGRTANSFNFNYRNNKLNLFGNLGFNINNGYSDLTINRYFEDNLGNPRSNFIQNSFNRNKGENYTSKIGADYYLSENSTIGINLTGIYNPSKRTTDVKSQFSNPQNQLDSTIAAFNIQDQLFKNSGVNLNFRQKLDKNGKELTADVDYLNYYTNNNQEFNNTSYLPSGAIKNSDLLTGMLPANINIFSAKTDYEHPFKNGVKLSAGLKTSYTETDNIANYFYASKGVTAIDYDKTNHFLYKENINAVYLNANKEYKKLVVQLGLRLENTVSNGHQLGNLKKPDSTFKRSYTNLFPTVYLQYKLDTADVNVFGINYGRRIDRPYYQDLNPFLSPIDKFTYYTGNPFLKPSFTDNIELSHTYKSRFTTTLSYSKTRNDVNETIEIVDGIYYSRPGNIGETTVKTLSFNGSFNFAKWLNYNFNGRVSNVHSVSDFYTGLLDTKGTYFFARSVFQFKLPKDWNLQLEGGYQSRIKSAQFDLGARGRVNVAASKKLSPGTTIKLVANDIFYTFKNTGIINNLSQTKANWTNLSDTRTGVLSLSYRFGKSISGQRNHDANGAEDEQNRVKN
ncbi:outer membrane beta-barrel protein [Pedobacter frigiditerrae]|uniref:outer membrane beta-barrel protein n=1 Tax=Pedobacter frigiditerrae TaxID=2530452 RepID=UPI00292D2EA3|nr:outer membrane beta-barrel protein [Pedobacter frigiditerrae]